MGMSEVYVGAGIAFLIVGGLGLPIAYCVGLMAGRRAERAEWLAAKQPPSERTEP